MVDILFILWVPVATAVMAVAWVVALGAMGKPLPAPTQSIDD